MQFHRPVELSLDHAHAVGEFLCDDIEEEGCLGVGVSQRPAAVRLDKALVKDDFHGTLLRQHDCFPGSKPIKGVNMQNFKVLQRPAKKPTRRQSQPHELGRAAIWPGGLPGLSAADRR
ncbi:hypothetical protein D3C87_1767330 [compost metagenome]